jgi:hypothetical protein
MSVGLTESILPGNIFAPLVFEQRPSSAGGYRPVVASDGEKLSMRSAHETDGTSPVKNHGPAKEAEISTATLTANASAPTKFQTMSGSVNKVSHSSDQVSPFLSFASYYLSSIRNLTLQITGYQRGCFNWFEVFESLIHRSSATQFNSCFS